MRTVVFTFLVTYLSLTGCPQLMTKTVRPTVIHSQSDIRLDGVYSFVREEVTLLKPRRETRVLAPPEWTGVWHFSNGSYSSVLMLDKRPSFFDVKNPDLGYESFAGRYTVDGDRLVLARDFSAHPFLRGHTTVMQYRFEDDLLILTNTLAPRLEDLREGTISVVLTRLKQPIR